jgi:hypothetical protein
MAAIVDAAWRYTLIIVLALLLNSGIYYRNWSIYNHPILTANQRTIVEKVTPSTIAANFLRNGAIHLASPFESGNQIIYQGLSSLLGYRLNAPESTFQEEDFAITFNINEDESGNILHFVFLVLAILVVPLLKNTNRSIVLRYTAAIILAITFYNLAIKWQPWGGRLQTPIFFLGIVLIGALLDTTTKKNLVPSMVLALFLLGSVPYLLLNPIRPFLPFWEDDSVFYDSPIERRLISGISEKLRPYPDLKARISSFLSVFYEGRSVFLTDRKELYFLGNIDDQYPYRAACHLIRNLQVHSIGLIMDNNDWEYPLWVFLNQDSTQGTYKIDHLYVENNTAKLAGNIDPNPDILLVTRADFVSPELSLYEQIYSSDPIQLYQLKE